MTSLLDSQPAIALVDDDYHSARLMIRMLAAHDGPHVEPIDSPDQAIEALRALAAIPSAAAQCMVLVDLKTSSTATGEFVARLNREVPGLRVVAMAPSLD